jgi:hypothetical protein
MIKEVERSEFLFVLVHGEEVERRNGITVLMHEDKIWTQCLHFNGSLLSSCGNYFICDNVEEYDALHESKGDPLETMRLLNRKEILERLS